MKALIDRNLSEHLAKNQYKFYYNRLSTIEQVVYDTLLDGYLKHKSSISVKAAGINEIWQIHNAICYDVPELFFVKTLQGSFNPLSAMLTVYPEYRFDFDSCERILVQMEKMVLSTVQRISMLGEREKVKQIHDFNVLSQSKL